jgi:uncharacterized membrane protein
MIFPTAFNDILLAILLVVYIVAGVYTILILIRLLSLMNRVNKMVSYADRVGVVLQSFEAIPSAIVSIIRQVALGFLEKGSKKK